MAINIFNNTITLITEYDPYISKAQNLVNPFMPESSNVTRSTRPKLAQNRDCEVSNKLKNNVLSGSVTFNGVLNVLNQEGIEFQWQS